MIETVAELRDGSTATLGGQSGAVTTTADDPQPSSFVPPDYRADIDGLRGAAVLAVIGFHAFPDWVTGGFVGVDVFFVVSGYLISTIILRSLAAGRFDFAQFYARRMKRIFPALIVVLVCCYWLGWNTLLADEFMALGKHIAAGAGFASNFVFWSESGYFDLPAETKPLLHLWSLGVEEQFYIIWPLMLWAAWRTGLNLLWVTVGVSFVSFASNIALSSDHIVAGFYNPATRLWELSMGGVLACSAGGAGRGAVGHAVFGRPSSFIESRASLRAALSVLGTVSIGFAVFALTKDVTFPGWWVLLPTIGTTLLIAAGPAAWVSRHVLSSSALVAVGVISYPLYLWHWPLLTFARILEARMPPASVRAAALVVAAVLAWMTYLLIEKPIRFGRAGRSALASGLLLVAMSATGVAGYVTYKAAGLPSRLHAFEEQLQAIKTVLQETPGCRAAIPLSDLRYCMLHDPSRPPTVALIGDSHANRLFASLSQRYAEQGDNLLQLGGGGCLPFWDIETGPPGAPFGCAKRMKPQLDYVLASPSLETVIMLHRGPYHVEGTEIFTKARSVLVDTRRPEVTDRLQIYSAGLQEALRRFTVAGKRVIVVIDSPEFDYDPTGCISLVRPFASPFSGRPNCRIPRDEVDDRNRNYLTLSKAAVQQHPRVTLVNLQDALCDEQYCHGMQDGRLLYRDADHLNAFGAEHCIRFLWPQFAA